MTDTEIDRYQIDAGVWPSKKPGHGMSGSRRPRRILRDSCFGWTWLKQDSGYVRFGEDSKMAVMFGEASIYLVHTPLG